MSKNKQKSDPEKGYSWLMSSDMYLAASVILCDEMLKSYSSSIGTFNSIQQIDKRCGFTSRNLDYEMLMPAVFNLKHSIELFLKNSIITINPNKEYLVSHNLINLIDEFKKELINDTKRYKIITTDISDLISGELLPIVEKYYYGLYAFSKDKLHPDVNNEAERYPEQRNGDCYKIELTDLDEEKINGLVNEIKGDCVKLQNIFRDKIWIKLILSIE